MVKEAESHAEEDKQRREGVEAKNQGEALVHSTEKMLMDFGDKVPEGDRSAVESALSELKEALQGEDQERIKSSVDAVAQASMKLGEAMYQASQSAEGAAGGGEAGGQPEGGAKDDVVDVDFEEVKDDDKKSA